jgi:hypothetical protein
MRLSAFACDWITIALIVVASSAVGVLIFAFGVAVRDVCLGAGLGVWKSNILALVACAPILAALYSIET